jgi:hypothetical protein
VDNGRTLVLATMEIVIQGFGSVDLIRSYDEETEFVRFDLKKKPE